MNTDNLASLPDDDSLIGIHTVMISSEEPHNLEPTQEEETLSRTLIPAVY